MSPLGWFISAAWYNEAVSRAKAIPPDVLAKINGTDLDKGA